MAMQTRYEVHVQQDERWSAHAQFKGLQREQALEEAKQLESGDVGSVKVIREVYDTAEGTHRKYIIYESHSASASDGKTDHTARGADGGGWVDTNEGDDVDDAPRSKRKAQKDSKKKSSSSLTTNLVKILLITLFSICLSAICVMITAKVLDGARVFGYRITDQHEGLLVFFILVVTFLLSTGIMTMTFFRGETLDTPESNTHDSAKAALKKEDVEQSTGTVKAKEKAKKQRGALDFSISGSEGVEIADQVAEETSKRLQQAPHVDDRFGNDAGGGGRGVALDLDTYDKVKPVSRIETLSPHGEKQKAHMMDFLGESLKKIGDENKKMDIFNKFGINLFLAGICETLAEKRDLDGRSRSKILSDGVRVMGFKKSHASFFADKYVEYLLQDPRYMQMFQAGRNAMNTHLQTPGDSAKHLQTAMGQWNQPKMKEAAASPVTVLFTDIAGSSAMIQTLGDVGVQEVVRAHNRIVRAALTAFDGREIKHTGDGIMASFSEVTDSVDASIQMQRETIQHNAQDPELRLGLKIGINAGEPIVEGNDLFGTVVQLSARIVDKAQADQIFVSEIVRGICTGKNYQFESKGDHAMKGFDGDTTLYEVLWGNEGAAAAE